MSKKIPVYLSEEELTYVLNCLSVCEDLEDFSACEIHSRIKDRLEAELATFQE